MSDITPTSVRGVPGEMPARRPRFRALRRLVRTPLVAFGLTVLGIVVLVAVFANVLAPYDPREISPTQRLLPPSAEHLLGTGHLGRDVLSRLLFGARVSLLVGVSTVLVSVTCGILIGVTAGYSRRVDDILMRVMDGLMAFPALLLAIALMAALGPRAANVVVALTIVYTPSIARLVRSAAIVVKNTEYVEAARSLGSRPLRVIFRHILPNCMSPVIVQATFVFANAVLAEAALSFLGVGIPPEIPSWGIMLNESRTFMVVAPWTTIAPGVGIMVTVLALNAVGDGLRDALDPRLKNI